MDKPTDEEGIETYRPSLRKLTIDIRSMREEVEAGFPSRSDVLKWEQRLTVRTLGEIPMQFYEGLARQFRIDRQPERDGRRRQGALLAALLTESARRRELNEETARELRERLVATYLTPAFHRAFRQLRKSAGEYIEKSDSAGHDPSSQSFIAMRPSLDEIDADQNRALTAVLDGLGDRSEILSWLEDVELATHGESDPGFGERCYKEPSTAQLLTSGEDKRAARELFAGFHLLPAFNRGVRDLVGRTGELPEVEHTTAEPKQV